VPGIRQGDYRADVRKCMKIPPIWGDKRDKKGQLSKQTLDDLADLKKEIKAIADKNKKREAREDAKSVKQMNMQENNNQMKINKKPNTAVSIKPLFTWRAVSILGLGLIAGILIALAWWLFSPSITGASNTGSNNQSQTTGLLGLIGMVPDGPYQSTVNIQVVNPGSDYTPLSTLQQRAEYYSAKTLSLPFFEYLSQELSKQIPGFSANTDKLGQMITSSYSSRTELPIIRVTVTAPTVEQAVALAELVPQDFNSYLVSEEKDKTNKDYNATLSAIDTVKSALYQAQQDLNTLKQNNISDTNPSLIILKAKVDALQQALNTQVTQISVQNVGDIQVEYNNTLEQINLVNGKINEAKQQIATLQNGNSANNTSDDSTRLLLDSKIRALQTQLDRYTASIVSMNDTLSIAYIDTSNAVNMTAQALSDARKELTKLQTQSTQNQTTLNPDYQIAQIKLDTLNTQQTTLNKKLSQLYQQIINAESVSTQTDAQLQFNEVSLALAQAKKDLSALQTQLGYDSLSTDLNLNAAQVKVNNLNARLQTLTQQLGSLVGGNINSLETDYLVAGNPTSAFPVLPQRAKAKSTLMMGAIAGIIIAWGLWNIKWILKQLKSLGAPKPDGNDEEQSK
jgi:hypothetical protein